LLTSQKKRASAQIFWFGSAAEEDATGAFSESEREAVRLCMEHEDASIRAQAAKIKQCEKFYDSEIGADDSHQDDFLRVVRTFRVRLSRIIFCGPIRSCL